MNIARSSKDGIPSIESLQATVMTKSADSGTLPLEEKSLYLFSKTNPFRIAIARLVSSKQYGYFILLIICFSCVMLTLDNPLLNPESTTRKVLNVTDWFFTVAFTVEMTLNVIARGLLFGEC